MMPSFAIKPPKLRIVLLGKVGSGKSTTGNNIINQNVFHPSKSEIPRSKLCQQATTNRFGQDIQIIVTPGLFDTERKHDEITSEIVKCIGLLSPGPHVFFMVVRIGRFTPEEKATVEHFHTVFGDDMFRHLAVLFTGKDDLKYDEMPIEEYVTCCSPELKKLLESCNNRYVAFDNRASPAEKDRDVQDLLILSNKIVQENHGQCYTSEMYKAAEKIIRLREEEQKKQREAERREMENRIKARVEKEMETEQWKQLARLEALTSEVKKKHSSVVTADDKYGILENSSYQRALIGKDQRSAHGVDPINRQSSSKAERERQLNVDRTAREDLMQYIWFPMRQIMQVVIGIGQRIVTLGNRLYAFFIRNNRN